MNNKVPIIVGPTAVGKTGISLCLAKRCKNIEILSADSRQIYKLMNIGTAKPTPEERLLVPHHFIDLIYPDEYYSAGKFGRDARQKIDELFRNNKTPIVVGGSGLYIQALVDGFFMQQISDQQIKARLKKEMTEKGIAYLYERLRQVDPVTTRRIHPNDGHRIVRALEVYELTGESLATFQSQGRVKANFEPIFIGLDRDRNKLYHIIEERIDQMIHRGLVDEVKQLQTLGYHSSLNSMQTVGYREVWEYLEGKIDFDAMVRLIKQHSRNYAKRQLTWFRNEQRIIWFDVDFFGDFDKLCDKILDNYFLISII